MGYWGWRPLVCGMFISTWVMGCTMVSSTGSPNNTPSPYPLITLTEGRMPGPTVPPIPSIASLMTVTPHVDSTEYPALDVEPPNCYPQRDSSLVCLGRVRNTLTLPVSAAELEIVLEGDGGEVSAVALIEQMNIPPAAYAPYSVTFSADDAGGRQLVYARINRFDPAPVPNVVTMDVSAIRGAISGVGERYVVSARISNPYQSALWLDRAVVMLTDERDQVVGYRTIRLRENILEPLASGGSTSIRVDVFLHTSVTTPTISIYVEGQPDD